MSEQPNDPTTIGRPRARRALGRWWDGLRPWQRRTTRQVAAILLTGVLSGLFGVFTASADTSIGPHEAHLSTTATHLVRVDLGPLGSIELDSPAPWPLGVEVDVGEIPDTLSELGSPLEGLGGDVAAYVQFFGDPQATVAHAVSALVTDAVERAVLTWSILLVVIAGVRLASGGLLRVELAGKLRRQGVTPLVVTTTLALVAVPVAAALDRPTPQGRTSTVLSSLGGAFTDARVTGRLASLVDRYGQLALDEVRKNDDFYDVVQANVATAYERDANPLAPARPLPATTSEPTPDEATPDEATPDEATPDEATLDESAGGEAAPDETAVGEAAPDETIANEETATPSGDATPSPSPTPSDPDVVTVMIVSDNHCNIGMGRVFGEIARQSGAELVLNAGDTTLGGSSVEGVCVDALATPLRDWPVVVADGNHDSPETGAQEAAAGWTVLDGGVVEAQGLRIVGDRDPRLTSVTLGTKEFATKAEAADALTTAACDATDPDDPSSVVDILLVHDPYVGNRVMPSGCIVLEVSGHLHRRIGPVEQGLGLLYVNASSGGAKEGVVPIGPLQAPAYVSVLQYDRANHVPVALREITIGTDQNVSLGDWEPFPVLPEASVAADLSLVASPAR